MPLPGFVAGALAGCTDVPSGGPSADLEAPSPEPTPTASETGPTVDPLQESAERGEQMVATFVDALDSVEHTVSDDTASKISDGVRGPAWEWKGEFILSARSEMTAQEAAEQMRDRLIAEDEGSWTGRRTSFEEADDLTFYDYSAPLGEGVAVGGWSVQIVAGMPEPPGEQYVRAYIYGPEVQGSP